MTTDTETARGICESYALNQLGSELNTNEHILLSEMTERWLETAKEVCNRKDMPLTMLHIVADTVVAAFNMRGNEGMASESSGVQSASYIDLHEKFRERLVSAGLRWFRG